MRPPILHVAPFLWSGAGGVITRLCEHQCDSGTVVIATTGRAEGLTDWPAYRRRLRRAGVSHHRIDTFHRDAPAFWSAVSSLASLLRTLRPGVIHAHAGVPCAVAAIARELTGSRARLLGQMYSWGTGRPAWMNTQDAWAFAQADRVVCSAHAYRRTLEALGVPPRQITYLPWGLPLESLPFSARESRKRGDKRGGRRHLGRPRLGGGGDQHQAAKVLSSGPPTRSVRPAIGFVGRIERRKGQLTLVEAFARLRRHLPEATLELIGPIAEPDYAQAVSSAITDHGLDRAVRMSGRVANPIARLSTWDLFVSLSEDEGQGLAVLEAMAVGVPVAARSVAGIEDFLSDGRTGWAIPRASAAAAASVMRHALEQPETSSALARHARRMVERRYDWAKMLQAFDRLYWR